MEFIIIIIVNIMNIKHLMKMRRSLEHDKYFFSEKSFPNAKFIALINNLLENIDKTLKAECKHDYVDDYIDIDYDKSQRICYCSKCMCSFPVGN